MFFFIKSFNTTLKLAKKKSAKPVILWSVYLTDMFSKVFKLKLLISHDSVIAVACIKKNINNFKKFQIKNPTMDVEQFR